MIPKPEEVLKQARKAKGMTQDDIARTLKISPRMYQRYENGDFPKYKSEAIETIDKLLGTKLVELIYDKKVPRETQVNEPDPNYGNMDIEKELLKKRVEDLEKIIALLEKEQPKKEELPPKKSAGIAK